MDDKRIRKGQGVDVGPADEIRAEAMRVAELIAAQQHDSDRAIAEIQKSLQGFQKTSVEELEKARKALAEEVAALQNMPHQTLRRAILAWYKGRLASGRSPRAGDGTDHAVPRVPRLGEVLAGLLCDPALREAILGDLAERFEERVRRRGPKAAKAWYWWQVVRSFGPFAWRWARRLIELDEILQRIGL